MKLEYSRAFVKQLKKAPGKIQKAVRQRLEIFLFDKYNPILNNHALEGKYRNFRSINISGDWRAVYRETGVGTVYFETLGTHRQLYK